MPFFSSKKKVKIDLTEHHRDKRKMGKNVDPSRAITEEEPWAIAQQAGKGISQLTHKDQYGNDIVDPDRSNPTRSRMERPLETIRSFERAIYNEELSRRPRQRASVYDNGRSNRTSMAYQYGDQSARQSTYDNYDNGSSFSHRPSYRQRYSGYDNGNGYSSNYQPANGTPKLDIPSDSNSGSYSNGGNSGWSGDPSTNPSSDASAYANYYDQQTGQSSRQPTVNDKPLPSVARQGSNGSPPMGYPNGGYDQQQQQRPQLYGSYTGNSQFAPQAQAQQPQYRQSYGQSLQAWNSQPAAPQKLEKKLSVNGGGSKRKSWFRRSKT